MSQQHNYSWGAPLPPIIPYLERPDPVRVTTELDRITASYLAEEKREQSRLQAQLQQENLAFFTTTKAGRLINQQLHREDARCEYIAQLDYKYPDRMNPDKRNSPITTAEEAETVLKALPAFLGSPLIRRLRFLQRRQKEARKNSKNSGTRQKNRDQYAADNFIRYGIKARLRRIEQTGERFMPLSTRVAVVRERLDDWLKLPTLGRDEIQRLAVLTAGVFATALDQAMDEVIGRTAESDDSDTAFQWLLAYQIVGRRALRLGVTPPYWEALELRPDRRGSPDLSIVPGAVSRIADAQWWNRKLRHIRDIWREELLRAAGLVSRQTSVYVSREALEDFREKQARTRDFLKAYDVENEDGERISLEDVYYASTSNPHNRRNEMMACTKGMELIAQKRGDVAFFITTTAPSRFHSVTEAGTLNPKYKGATVKDASNYLVNTFFSSVRKAIDKKKLGWYGIRTVEPHHDGTPHWHMLVFTSPENEEKIVKIMRNAAIREDRAELGDDITPRFKCEKIDPARGTPTSYIATYIGKNVDSRAVEGIDQKTGKPRLDHESGKTMADTVENAIAWARLHRIRQFQFFGIPSRQVWREFRRLAGQMARNPSGPQKLPDPKADALLAAADVGCFASYIAHQGGVLVPRSEYLARTAYITAEEPNDYGEFPERIYGIQMPQLGENFTICTHPEEWKLVKKETEADNRTGEVFDLQGDPVAPWTRGNNCRHDEKTTRNSAQTGQSEWAKLPPLPPSSDGFVDWFKSLRRPERKNLQRLLKKRTEESRQNASGGTGTPADAIRVDVVLPELPEIAQIRRELEALGADFPDAMAHSVFMGGRVCPGDGRTVHRDAQTGRITITRAQPEVNP